MGPRSCERGNSPLARGEAVRMAASMGPRSCERGNGIGSVGSGGGGGGFNAPGAFFAGQALAPSAAAVVAEASMGPRSCERGNPRREPIFRSPVGRFNGAALVRARK